MDGADSGSCPVAGFGILRREPSGSATMCDYFRLSFCVSY